MGITDKDELLGREVIRSIPAQQLILPSMVQKVELVRRHDIVEVISRVGHVQVTTKAIAKTGGGMGDTITVRDERTKSLIQGRVSGPGQVVVSKKSIDPLPIAAVKPSTPIVTN
jgi:flagella basal body P-ring formation protein FlgA